MRSRLLLKPFTILISCLSIAIATPRVSDALILPLRIPPQQCLAFNASAIGIPPDLGPPKTQCTWADIFDCAAKEINCGQICLETKQRVPSDLSTFLPPQCTAYLSPATISHCALCYGSHIPTGQAPATAATISRTQLCAAAKKIPQAKCIADGFCDDKDLHATTTTTTAGSGLEGIALVDAIIDNLGGGAVGNVNVQQPGGVVAAAPSGSGSGSGSGGGEGAGNGGGQGEGDGRNGAVGLCGSYRCLRGR